MKESTARTIFLTTAAGKRLIGIAVAEIDEITDALLNRTVVIIAGTTNSYVAEELLKKVDQSDDFDRKVFFRGITLPPNYNVTESGRISRSKEIPGDVIIQNGKWLKNQNINDIAYDLKRGDIIIKGANAVNFRSRQAGILIGDQRGGTIMMAMQAIIGRRVKLYLPAGLEKRVSADLHSIAVVVNSPNAQGYRYCVVSGEIISEIEAVKILTGAEATLIAAGGVCGAEGGIWLSISGEEKIVNQAVNRLKGISIEPSFTL